MRLTLLTLQFSAEIEEAGRHWPSQQSVQPPHLYPYMHVQTTSPADQGQRSRRVFVASSLTRCLNLMATLFDNSKRHTNVDTYCVWDPHMQYFCRAVLPACLVAHQELLHLMQTSKKPLLRWLSNKEKNSKSKVSRQSPDEGWQAEETRPGLAS